MFAPGRFLTVWTVFAALYLLLALEWQMGELVAGTICAAISAWLLLTIRRWSEARFPVRLRWFWFLARRLPGKALADCTLLLRAFGTDGAPGVFRAVPFDADAEEQPGEAAARRAVVIAGASLSPNSVVVAVDRKQNRLLVHQLVPTRTPPGDSDRLWPV